MWCSAKHSPLFPSHLSFHEFNHSLARGWGEIEAAMESARSTGSCLWKRFSIELRAPGTGTATAKPSHLGSYFTPRWHPKTVSSSGFTILSFADCLSARPKGKGTDAHAKTRVSQSNELSQLSGQMAPAPPSQPSCFLLLLAVLTPSSVAPEGCSHESEKPPNHHDGMKGLTGAEGPSAQLSRIREQSCHPSG